MDQISQWLTFVQERWLILLISLIALIIIIKVVKTLVKWVLVIAIVAALVFYGVNYTDEIKEAAAKVWDYTQSEFQDMLNAEIDSAQYEADEAGHFTIKSKNFTVEGSIDSDDVKITFKGQTVTLKRYEWIERYIQDVQSKQ